MYMIHMQINLHAVSQARSNQPWRGLLSEGTNPSANRLQCYMRDTEAIRQFFRGWLDLACETNRRRILHCELCGNPAHPYRPSAFAILITFQFHNYCA